MNLGNREDDYSMQDPSMAYSGKVLAPMFSKIWTMT